MDAFTRLRPQNDTKQAFIQYFNDGLNIADSMKKHELDLHVDPTSLEIANGHINPKHRTVRHWYEEWRSDKFGPKSGPAVLEVR